MAAGVAAVAVLLATGVVTVQRKSTDAQVARTRKAATAAVPQLQRFVEARRGLAFRHPVAVEVLDDKRFVAALFAGDGEERPTAVRYDTGQTLAALHLVGTAKQFDSATHRAYAGGVAGFYSPRTGRLVVRGVDFTVGSRVVLVHELTHALDDQYFALDKVERRLSHDDEARLAWRSLAEGDATAVERDYVRSLSTADKSRLRAEWAGEKGSDPEPLVSHLLGFPYVAGLGFVDGVRAARGTAGLDAAFRRPPTTSEQVLHPREWVAGRADMRAATQSFPHADGTVVDRGVLGQLALGILLGGTGGTPVPAALAGWRSDAYVTWQDRLGRPCVRADLLLDGETSRDRLAFALSGWARRGRGSVRSRGATGLRIDACGRA